MFAPLISTMISFLATPNGASSRLRSLPLGATLWDTVATWFGYDRSAVPPDSKVEFLFTSMPESWGVFVLIAAVVAMLYGVIYLYRRELATCPQWVKIVLASLRCGVVLLLTLIFLGPSLVYLQNREIRPTLILARDASQSMNTADRYDDEAAAASTGSALNLSLDEVRRLRPTRTQIVNKLLSDGKSPLLDDLATRGKVQALDFSDHVDRLQTRSAVSVGAERPVSATPADAKASPDDAGDEPPPTEENASSSRAPKPPLPMLAADGRGTDLWMAIRESMSADSPAAVVLFTDGQHTGRDDPRIAAREAKERGIPLYIVGVGDPSKPRNLKVASLYVRPQVWQDEPFEIDAIITAQGIEAGDVRVELIEQKVSESDQALGSSATVQTLQLEVPDGGGRLRAQFSHTAKESGRFVYSVRVQPVDDEIFDDDNQTSSSVVKVLSREKVRVLLVAGAPTWEFRLLQKLLARDKTIVVSCWLQTLDEERAQEGTRQITRLPTTREELFYYDVIMLFDPNPQEFDEAWIELLKQFVGEHSGGLLFMAGPKHSGRLLTGARTSEIQKILPISFGDVGALEVASLLSSNQRSWPLKVTQANVDHPVMRFYPDRQETLQRWETLPGIFWSFPSQQPKPTATVLLEHSDPTLRSVEGPRPLLVAGRYGSGHTLYLGFNGTWRWRRAGRQAEFFDKFWIQTTRYLVEGRALEGRRRGFVQTDRDFYEIGQRVTISARLQDATYNPLVVPKVEATLQAGSNQPETLTLLPVTNQPGNYEAALTARATGVFTIRMSPTSEGDGETNSIQSSFTVELPSVETNQVWLDKPLLTELASLSGGQYFEVNEVSKLAAAIPDKTEILETRGRPQALWDTPGIFGCLIVLLALEWWIRKQFKLL